MGSFGIACTFVTAHNRSRRLLNVQERYQQNGMDGKIPKYYVGVLSWDYGEIGGLKALSPDMRARIEAWFAGKLLPWLQQAQLAGTGYRFGASLDL